MSQSRKRSPLKVLKDKVSEISFVIAAQTGSLEIKKASPADITVSGSSPGVINITLPSTFRPRQIEAGPFWSIDQSGSLGDDAVYRLYPPTSGRMAGGGYGLSLTGSGPHFSVGIAHLTASDTLSDPDTKVHVSGLVRVRLTDREV